MEIKSWLLIIKKVETTEEMLFFKVIGRVYKIFKVNKDESVRSIQNIYRNIG